MMKLTLQQRRDIAASAKTSRQIADEYGISVDYATNLRKGCFADTKPAPVKPTRTDLYRSRHYTANWDATS